MDFRQAGAHLLAIIAVNCRVTDRGDRYACRSEAAENPVARHCRGKDAARRARTDAAPDSVSAIPAPAARLKLPARRPDVCRPGTKKKPRTMRGLSRQRWQRRQAMMLTRVPCPGGSAACTGGGAVRGSS